MKTRINKRLVTFLSPFSLDSLNADLPAGDYTIETLEETVSGPSFRTYRGLTTTMIVRPKHGTRGLTQFLEIDPTELDAALARDALPIQRAENEGLNT
jgi:hypothetical protein